MQFFTYKMKQMADGGHIPDRWPASVTQTGIPITDDTLMGASQNSVAETFRADVISTFAITPISEEDALEKAATFGMRDPQIGPNGIYDADPLL